MNIQQLITAGILGACMGSFLNVAAHRSLQGRSWWGNERSVCESCGHVLSPVELIPIISWLLLRGKCKNCGANSLRDSCGDDSGALGHILGVCACCYWDMRTCCELPNRHRVW